MSKDLSRREFLRWSMVGSAALVLASCAPKPTPTPPPKVEEKVVEKEAEPTKAEEKVQLRYQSRHGGGPVGKRLWAAFFEYFYDKNPNVEVEWLVRPEGDQAENILSQMVAGDGPDVYQLCCWQTTFFIQQGQALNLQPYINRDAEEVDIDDFYSQQFVPWILNGDIHFMPYYTGTMVLYYNKDMFDEVGVDYLPSEWGELSFDEYRETCAKFVVREKPLRWGTSNYGQGANWLTQYWLRGFGANMVDPNDPDASLLCKPEALECLEHIRQMIHEEKSFAQGAEMGGVGVHQFFNNKSIAMMEMGSWGLSECLTGAAHVEAIEAPGTDWLDFVWDLAPMWTGAGGKMTHQSVDGQGVWSQTPHPEESWQLCKEVASAEFEMLNITVGDGMQPSRKSVMPFYVDALRKQWPILEEVHLEVMAEAMTQDIPGPEEMFNNDKLCKDQILKPAFDLVFLENKAPVELICEHSKVVAKFNKGEIGVEDIGGELAKIRV